MGARNKLNSAHVVGTIGLAIVIAMYSGSLTLGLITFLALLAADIAFGNVRSSPQGR